MKKLLVTILTIIMASTMALGLVACGGDTGDAGHEHKYSSKNWKYDNTHHWKEALCEGCEGQIGMKEEHTWGEGIVDGTGAMVYQCTKCPATKK